MNNKSRNVYFDDYFKSIFEDSNPLTRSQFEESCLRFENEIGRFLPENLNDKILDIGCGCGHFLYYLNNKGYTNFSGIDISAQQVKYCEENITENE